MCTWKPVWQVDRANRQMLSNGPSGGTERWGAHHAHEINNFILAFVEIRQLAMAKTNKYMNFWVRRKWQLPMGYMGDAVENSIDWLDYFSGASTMKWESISGPFSSAGLKTVEIQYMEYGPKMMGSEQKGAMARVWCQGIFFLWWLLLAWLYRNVKARKWCASHIWTS